MAKLGILQRSNPRITQLTAVGINIPNITESLVQAPLKIPDLAVLFKKKELLAQSYGHCTFVFALACSLLDYLRSLNWIQHFCTLFFPCFPHMLPAHYHNLCFDKYTFHLHHHLWVILQNKAFERSRPHFDQC